MKDKKLVGALLKLVALNMNSRNLYLTAEETVILAFREKKPLFVNAEEKAKAADLIKRSLPHLQKSFAQLHGSMNPDRRQLAQICRSGLQFLVDEFKDTQNVYDEIKPIVTSSPVRCVEEYIENSKDLPPEWSAPSEPDLTQIPTSHYWWF